MAFVGCVPLQLRRGDARAPLTSDRRDARYGRARCAKRAACIRARGGGEDGGSGGELVAEEDELKSLDALNAQRSGAGAAQAQAGASQAQAQAQAQAGADAAAAAAAAATDERSDAQKEVERLRAAEKFITVDEGRYECPACGYVYEPDQGDKAARIAPGTPFSDVADGYFCPVCRTPKRRFVPRKKVIAGFADNQAYGLGSNSMTAGQKNLAIFGGLVLAFLLLLSGYALN